MKYLLSVTIFFILFQDSPRVISLKEYYKYDSVIFGNETNYPFSSNDYKSSHNLSVEDVIKAEEFLINNYFYYESIVSKHFKSKFPKAKYSNPKKVKSKFYKHRRHYIGYINHKGDTIINIILNEFNNEIFLKDGTWKNDIYFSSNSKMYTINLTKNKYVFDVIGLNENGEK